MAYTVMPSLASPSRVLGVAKTEGANSQHRARKWRIIGMKAGIYIMSRNNGRVGRREAWPAALKGDGFVDGFLWQLSGP